MPRRGVCQARECNKNHASEFFQTIPQIVQDTIEVSPGYANPHCWPCRSNEAAKEMLFKDYGKGPSDCRFQHSSPPHYHQLIPGYGPAADFDPPIHNWNCLGHTCCRHGQTGVVEARALTFHRDSTVGYKVRPELCCGTVWCLMPPSAAKPLTALVPYF